MADIANDASAKRTGREASPGGDSARKLRWHLIWLYAQGSMAAVVIIFILAFLGLQFTGYQWLIMLLATPVTVGIYVMLDIYFIDKHYRPLGKVLAQLDGSENPSDSDLSKALVRALNLPFYSFIRVIFIHGPGATLSMTATLLALNARTSAVGRQ